ncbi:hypothetical protein HYS93_04185 [Candidatus Daviesbacteria bacterium]|nr:hypothetical protein [Candidatus Daviesbacteria bacterium]
MILVSTVHDPLGIFNSLVRDKLPELNSLFRSVVASVTTSTDKKLIKTLKDRLGWTIIPGAGYSEAKVAALKKALSLDEDKFFFCDLDKILHWLEVAPRQLSKIEKIPLKVNYLILGRDRKTFATYPDSWIKTEEITNFLLSKELGVKVDALAATCLINREGAKVIVEKANGKNWESPIEWPLLIKKNGLRLGYREAKGLTWEDPDRSKAEIKRFGGITKWEEEKFDSLEEWSKRISAMYFQVKILKEIVDSK